MTNLPTSLKYLGLPEGFNNTVTIPSNLRVLIFGIDYSQSLPLLPPTLTHLCLGKKFHGNLTDLLPASLTHLVIAPQYKRKIRAKPGVNISVEGDTMFKDLDGRRLRKQVGSKGTSTPTTIQ